MATHSFAAFQGGGALGLAHLGAWQVLAQRFEFRGVAGTSAGSIVASLCAAGYDSTHAIDLFRNIEWGKFVKNESNIGRLIKGVIAATRKQQGLNDGEAFRTWMLERLAARFPNLKPHELTFERLNERTDVYLAIVACDLNNESASPHIFDKEREPKVIVANAVRASIAIPGIFTPVPSKLFGQELVDGMLLLNFPIELLHPQAQRAALPLIGVRFKNQLKHLENPTIVEVMGRSLELMLRRGSIPPSHILNDPNYIDVEIDDTGMTSTNFNLSEAEKDELIRRGAVAAEKAIDAYDRRSRPTTQSSLDPLRGELGKDVSSRDTSPPIARPETKPSIASVRACLRTLNASALQEWLQEHLPDLARQVSARMTLDDTILLVTDHCLRRPDELARIWPLLPQSN